MTAAPYREKTLVLCGVEVTTRERGSTLQFLNFVAVEAEFQDQIEDELVARMAYLKTRNHWPGHFVDWRWVSYLPKTGTRTFTGREIFN